MSFTKTRTNNLKYGSAMGVHDTMEDLLLDIVQPNNTKPHPLLIVIHGGGGFAGTKDAGLHPMFDAFVTQLGVTAIFINYRLADTHQFVGKTTEQSTVLMHEECFRTIEDAKAAARFVIAQKKYNIDPKQIIISGVSFGAVVAEQAIHWELSEYKNDVDIDKWKNDSNLPGADIDFMAAVALSGAIFTKDDIDATTKPIIQWVGLLDTTLKPNGGSNHRCPYIGGIQIDDASEYYSNPIFSLIEPNAGHCGKVAGDAFATALVLKKAQKFFIDNLKTIIH